MVEIAFGLKAYSLPNLARRHRTDEHLPPLPHYGRIYRSGGGTTLVFQPIHIAQVLGRMRSFRGSLPPQQIEAMLRSIMAAMEDKIPQTQKHLNETPIERLRWASDYRHHGGASAPPTNHTGDIQDD